MYAPSTKTENLILLKFSEFFKNFLLMEPCMLHLKIIEKKKKYFLFKCSLFLFQISDQRNFFKTFLNFFGISLLFNLFQY